MGMSDTEEKRREPLGMSTDELSKPSGAATTQIATPADAKPNDGLYTATDNDGLIREIEDRRSRTRRLSSEDVEKLRKRQKRDEAIAGIGDAVRAVANLYFTHKGSPNMYDDKNTMSDKVRQRYDREWSEREADDDRWLKLSLMQRNLMDADKDRALKQAQQKTQNDRAAAKDAMERRLTEAKIRGAKADADAKETYAGYVADLNEAEIANKRAKKEYYDRLQPKGPRPPSIPWRDANGNLHHAYTEAEARAKAGDSRGSFVTTPRRSERETIGLDGKKKVLKSQSDVSTEMIHVDWKK